MSIDVLPQLPPRRSLPRPSSSALAALVALVLVVVGAAAYLMMRPGSITQAPTAPVVAAGGATAIPPAASLALMTSAALATGSVHAQITSRENGRTVRMSQDVRATSGVQRIRAAGGHALVRVIGSDTYFTADRAALLGYFQVTATSASKLAGRWVHLTPGHPGYRPVTTGVTLRSVLQEMKLAGPLTRLPARPRHGQLVFGIRGIPTGHGVPPHATATMWITVGKTALPVEYDAAAPNHDRTVVRMSRWGRASAAIRPPGRSVKA
jgi:hypothetical protein